jgi:hypothetical protein
MPSSNLYAGVAFLERVDHHDDKHGSRQQENEQPGRKTKAITSFPYN